MARTRRAATEGEVPLPPPEVDVLVDGIQKLLRAAQTLRQMGVTDVSLPLRLVAVCREVLEEVDTASGVPSIDRSGRRSRTDSSSQAISDTALRDIPLRRLLLQLVAPGETFTVPEIVSRLLELGKQVDPAKVSNALGYQVDRGNLVRERKGVYTYPEKASPAGNQTATAYVEQLEVHEVGAVGESQDDRRAVWARGQEERSGSSKPAQGRQEAG